MLNLRNFISFFSKLASKLFITYFVPSIIKSRQPRRYHENKQWSFFVYTIWDFFSLLTTLFALKVFLCMYV